MSKRQTLGWTRKETSSGDNQKLTAQGEFFFTKAVGQKTEVTDALKARRQRVDEKAADKFIGSERHPARLLFVPVAVVFRLKRDFALFHVKQALVGDGDSMSVTAQIGQHLFWRAERRLGVDDPVALAPRCQISEEG